MSLKSLCFCTGYTLSFCREQCKWPCSWVHVFFITINNKRSWADCVEVGADKHGIRDTFTSGTATQKGDKMLNLYDHWTVWGRRRVSCGNASPPNGPITVVAVCITTTCSYISGELHIKLLCRLWCGPSSYMEAKQKYKSGFSFFSLLRVSYVKLMDKIIQLPLVWSFVYAGLAF